MHTLDIARATEHDLLNLLFKALESEHGISVQCSNGDVLRRQLYSIRRGKGAALEGLMLRISPTNPNEVWIIK